MNLSTLKRKRESLAIQSNKNCTKINKTVNFKDVCKEITRKQIEVVKLGKFVVKNLLEV